MKFRPAAGRDKWEENGFEDDRNQVIFNGAIVVFPLLACGWCGRCFVVRGVKVLGDRVYQPLVEEFGDCCKGMLAVFANVRDR